MTEAEYIKKFLDLYKAHPFIIGTKDTKSLVKAMNQLAITNPKLAWTLIQEWQEALLKVMEGQK